MYHYLNTFENEGICEDLMDCHMGLYRFFCDYSELSFWKNDLSAIFEQVLQHNPSFKLLSPKSIINQGGEFLHLIYIGFFLFQKTQFPPCPNPSWKELILKHTRKRSPSLVDRIRHLPQYLNPKEIEDPYLVLKDFYYRRQCFDWARRWNQLIEESFSSITCLEPEDIALFQADFRDFYKLLEAIYLIYVRHFSPEMPDGYDSYNLNFPVMF
ncbi:hypothetical protein [Algoriphagus algorifonticola]|uniref:hypothetical protein n=1 Tax=Algoriphagus algorifonticola TaxID=2593007 RepID=UPI0011AA30C8|nr:hypothetical protein [Algoriphagus algorifonticola]